MAWTLKFWLSSATPPATPVTWNYGTGIAPSDVPSFQVSSITQYINSIASISTLAESRLNSYGQDIRIGYRSGDVGTAVRGATIDDYILIDISAAITLYFFNTMGQLVAGDVRLTIMHELAHNYLNANDPSANPTEAAMNSANFDFRGPVVDEQNAIAEDAGLTNQVQSSYYAAILGTEPLFGSFTANMSYSNGNAVDITRLGTTSVDNINHSNNTIRISDLIFGLEGNDTINGGKGDDSIYGGSGQLTAAGSGRDKLYGGDGGDRLFGGDDNDFLDSGFNVVDSDPDGSGDALDGGSGHDILVIRGRWLESATGGAGDDQFWIDSEAEGSYWIADSEAGDALYFDGYRLLGGAKQVIELIHDPASLEGCYAEVGAIDSYGFRYYWDGDQLSIAAPNDAGILIQNFQNGDFGINVGSPSAQFDVEFDWVQVQPNIWEVQYQTSLALSPIANNGQDWDFHNLPGYAATLANDGPNALPTTWLP